MLYKQLITTITLCAIVFWPVVVVAIMNFTYSDDITDNIFIRIYTQNWFAPYQYKQAKFLLNSPYYSPNLSTVFFCHGWTENGDSQSTRTIVSSYLENGNWNIIGLDYGNLVKRNDPEMKESSRSMLFNYILKIFTVTDKAIGYYSSVRNSSKIGTAIGDMLTVLVRHGMDPKRMHIVGHSLGGHVAAFACKTFINNTGQRISQLTALDPAGPIFVLPNVPKLDRSDADVVNVIHTDPNVYGYPESLGTFDFYPNMHLFKNSQPGCVDSDGTYFGFCSHQRSWQYFSEAVLNPAAFPAIYCLNKYAFLLGWCDKNQIIHMGEYNTEAKSGDYYLETDSTYPFGKGELGISIGEYLDNSEISVN